MGLAGIGWRHAHYGQLLQALPTLPFLEVHSENFFGQGGAALAVLEQARGHYPISLHGVGLGLGSACGIDPWHVQQLVALAERIDPVRVSDHACFARAVLPGDSVAGGVVHGADLLPLPFSHAALDVLCANVQQVQDALKRPLAVENLSAYVSFNEQANFSEPEFLNALARRSGCHLLVDVNNIYVNALNDRLRGVSAEEPLISCRRWLDAIDASAVAELHVAGHCVLPGVVIDDHGSRVCAEVWQLYAHALERFGPVPSLVEWDTDVPALEVLLHEAAHADAIAQSVAQAAMQSTAQSATKARA